MSKLYKDDKSLDLSGDWLAESMLRESAELSLDEGTVVRAASRVLMSLKAFKNADASSLARRESKRLRASDSGRERKQSRMLSRESYSLCRLSVLPRAAACLVSPGFTL